MEDKVAGAPGRNKNSYAGHLLGLLKEPKSYSARELDESDIVWSRDFSGRRSSVESSTVEDNVRTGVISPLSPASSAGRRRHAFKHERSGLSAALAVENRSFVQRKNELASIASAWPVTISRSGSGWDGFTRGGGTSVKYHQSAPVKVPVWPKVNRRTPIPTNLDEDDDEMLPPHLFVARQSERAHVTAFSVFEGIGRTLKGRDLRRVRNAVFKKTGFLD